MSGNDEIRLERANEADIESLMTWFATEFDVKVWGGPKFRFPFTRESFIEDVRFHDMATFVLRDAGNAMVAFGQLYNRHERINLARLVVRKDRRGQGLGKALIEELMQAGAALLPLAEFSLFVYRDNKPALECYRSMGFEITEYPEGDPLADKAFYLIRPIEARRSIGGK